VNDLPSPVDSTRLSRPCDRNEAEISGSQFASSCARGRVGNSSVQLKKSFVMVVDFD
jgi:hypothetical protein